MIEFGEAIKAIEYHTKVDISRNITALTILDKDESVVKSSQTQIEIPKLFDALITMYHEINRNGSTIGGLTIDEVLTFKLELTKTLQRYPSAYGAAMQYLYRLNS